MPTDGSSLTLVYLMYNEEESIESALEEGVAFVKEHVPDWEIVVVDDGSKDRCAELVAAIAETEPRLRLIQHEVNSGMGAGMKTGIKSATKDLFVFLPADGQIEAAEIAKMIPMLGRADIVLSDYGNRPNSFLRTAMSRGFRLYLRTLAGVKFRLEGLYLYPRELALEVLDDIEGNTFFFSFQLIQLGVERGASTALTTIASKHREAGKSKVGNWPRIKRVGLEVWDYRQRRRRR
jgi:glycosyltransferase involved in cell wall biosynthesis